MTEPTPPYANLAAEVPRKTNVLAIVALIAAIFLPLIGVILGIVAHVQIRGTGEGGRGLATGAIIVGIILTIVGVLVLIFATTVIGSLFCWGAAYCVV